MRRLISAVCAATLIAPTAVVPSTASPLFPQPRFEVNDPLIQVGSKKWHHHHGKRRHHHRRHDYHDDWWIPGAIIGGLIIGGMLSQPRYHRPAGTCGYWSQRCSANWSRPSDYRGCMRYHGC